LTRADIDRLFHPKSVAIVGASRSERRRGNQLVKAFLDFGFEGPIYPINPQADEIRGLKAYPSMRDVPEPVDYAYIIIPRNEVLPTIHDCGANGTKFAVIFTAGFSETGKPDATELENHIAMAAAKSGLRLIGPNCVGVHCPSGRVPMYMGFSSEPGRIAFVSQSGGFSFQFQYWASARDMRFSKVVSYGNACDLDSPDFLEYLVHDQETEIVALYIEGVKDGRRFLATLRELAKVKPVIALKGGQTDVGSQVAASHTGAMAGDATVWRAIFKQAGVVSTQSFEELLDTALAFYYGGCPEGRRIGVLGSGGGSSVNTTDILVDEGLVVPKLSAETQKKMESVSTEIVAEGEGLIFRNPIDFHFTPPEDVRKYSEFVSLDPNIDIVLGVRNLGPQAITLEGESRVIEVIDAIKEGGRMGGKPFFMVLKLIHESISKGERIGEIWSQETHECSKEGIAAYPTLPRAARALSNLVEYYELARKGR